MYYMNWAFDLKMVFLLLAVLFNYTIHRKTAMSDPPGAKVVACVSLGLWTCVLFGGIFIGFLNSTLDFGQI
jgi:nucleoside recognition membrane protein YjiH